MSVCAPITALCRNLVVAAADHKCSGYVHEKCVGWFLGNRKGLLVPSITSDTELQHLRNALPDSVEVRRVEERLSALGNCIATNDYTALVHADLDKETEEIVQDVLQVGSVTEFLVGTGPCRSLSKGILIRCLSLCMGEGVLAGGSVPSYHWKAGLGRNLLPLY